MTIGNLLAEFKDEGKVIATFGRATLVKTLEDRYELRGGSKEDRLTAYEWISLFMHHVVVRETSC
jgi:hypothetical protein